MPRLRNISDNMTREIRINAFDMNCVGHLSPGLWTHPNDKSHLYKDLEYWTEIAQLLERGKIDGLFLADVLGVYDVYNGSIDTALINATQVPVNDPLQIIPPMALVTKHLGFGMTASITFEHPYTFARRMSTMDHLTKGRAGWNIVTSYLHSAARNIGQNGLIDSTERYAIADEYLEVCYKLWEGSWEDGAVIADRARGIYTDPTKVHPIHHEGKYFKVPGIHLSEPSPQRTPVLYQAGASSSGKAFGAANAECVFVSATSKSRLKHFVSDMREQVQAAGRDPHDVLIFNMQTVIVGETDQEARAKYREFQAHASFEGAMALFSGWSGIDFGQYTPDQLLSETSNKGVQALGESYRSADPTKAWSVRDLAEWTGVGGDGPFIVGSAQTVADELQDWVECTDVDGFNLAYAVTPDSFVDLVELLVPELQKRGAFKKEYAPGTYREKLFGRGPRLPETHRAASFRSLGLEGTSSDV